jgi:ferredoxin-NADP reductase
MTTVLAVSPNTIRKPAAGRFHRLRVKRVVRETVDTRSFVLDVPAELGSSFTYRAGQYVTLRVVVDGETHFRSYSMSSTPTVDAHLQITVKRMPGGVVSNWLNDRVVEGSFVEATIPAGTFVLDDTDRDIVAFAGGSGITPVFSILKSALATTRRRAHLLYANRDLKAVIFADELDGLAARHRDLLSVTHRADDDRGLLAEEDIVAFGRDIADAEFYVCGPSPFMDLVERSLIGHGVSPDRLHFERFTVDLGSAEGRGGVSVVPSGVELSLTVAGRSAVVSYRPGTTILESARAAGLRPPSSCETGNCGTCMARITEGRVETPPTELLTSDELAQGWVLTCQAVPDSPRVHVIYD